MFSFTLDKKKLTLASKNFWLFYRQKECKIPDWIAGIFFFYDVTMSRDGAVKIVGVFEKHFGEKYARKLKISKNLPKGKKIDYDDVIDPSDDVITSGTKFLF